MTAVCIAALLAAVTLQAPQTPPVSDTVSRAERLIQSGSVPQGIALLEEAVKATPQSFDVHLALGRALDLEGRHVQARRQFEQAIALAPEDRRNQALTAMGISWAFLARANEAARYYQRVFDVYVQANDRNAAGAIANALGRIYLESGNLAKAVEWYRTGYETSKQIPQQSAATRALWEMRWHNAQGRIAARRSDRRGAMEHAAQVKALLDKGGNENQQQFYPYLLGYIAFYAKDYRQAIAEFEKGDLEDPFVAGLVAQAYDKVRDRAKAREFFTSVMADTSHSINNAFARPYARKYLK